MKIEDGLHITTYTDKRRKHPYSVSFDPIESFAVPCGRLKGESFEKVEKAITNKDVTVKCLNSGFIWVWFKSEKDAEEFTTFIHTLKRDTDWR